MVGKDNDIITASDLSTDMDVDGDHTHPEATAQQLFPSEMGQKQPETDPNGSTVVNTTDKSPHHLSIFSGARRALGLCPVGPIF